jgi:hypothetical protein
LPPVAVAASHDRRAGAPEVPEGKPAGGAAGV